MINTTGEADRILELLTDLFMREKHREVMLLGEVGLSLVPSESTRRLLQEKMSVSGYWCGNETGLRLGRDSAESLSLDKGATSIQRDFARQCSTWFSTDVRSIIPSTRVDQCDPTLAVRHVTEYMMETCKSTVISVDNFIPVTASLEINGRRIALIQESIIMQWGGARHLHRFIGYDAVGRLSLISPRFYFLSIDGETASTIEHGSEEGTILVGFAGPSSQHVAKMLASEVVAIMRQIPRYGSGAELKDEDDAWLTSVTNKPMQSLSDLNRVCELMKSASLPVSPAMDKNWHAMLGLHHATESTSPDDLMVHISASWDHPFLNGMVRSGYSNLASLSITDDHLGTLANVAYHKADCTRTSLMDSSVAFLSCCDIAEQNSNMQEFIAESARILRPNGLMLISFDYWQDQLDARGMILGGSDPKIMDRFAISEFLEIAGRFNLVISGDVSLVCNDRTVSWGDMEYTILSLLMRKI